MPKAAAIYCRISRDRGGEALGVARQETDCRAWCEQRKWPIGEVFVDNDVSAYSGKRRPAFERMVEGIKAGQLDAVVVWHPDRLTRSTRELEGIIDLVEATRVTVGTVTAGDYDLTTPEGRLTARIVGAVARKESEDKSRRIRRKHLELAEAGDGRGGGTRPFGFNPDRLTINQPEADCIREAAARILAGDRVRGVAADWNRRGIPTTSGGRWTAFSLRRMLLSARIAGLRAHHGAVTATAVWPAIIDPADHVRLTAVLKDPARRTNGGASRYLLTGFVVCHACGARLVARPTERKVRRYVCATGPGFRGCGKTYVAAQDLEDAVTGAVLVAIASPHLEAAVDEQRVAADGEDPVAEMAEIEERQAQLAEMWAAGQLGNLEWSAARAALDRRMDAARGRVVAEQGPRITADLPADLEGLQTLWPTLSFDRQRAIIGAVVDKVTIGPGRRGYNRFDLSRVGITWRA
jgi:DNA invertase Pin-like site-specific DNA recombinase